MKCLNRYAELESKYGLKKTETIEYKTKANYWEEQFHRVKSREEKLAAEIEELKAKLRKREQELFGKSTEKCNARQESNLQLKEEFPKKNRGQQPGSQGHGRRDDSHLPIELEELELAEESSRCPCCHKPYVELPGYTESDSLEVDVKAYRRVVCRKKY